MRRFRFTQVVVVWAIEIWRGLARVRVVYFCFSKVVLSDRLTMPLMDHQLLNTFTTRTVALLLGPKGCGVGISSHRFLTVQPWWRRWARS